MLIFDESKMFKMGIRSLLTLDKRVLSLSEQRIDRAKPILAQRVGDDSQLIEQFQEMIWRDMLIVSNLECSLSEMDIGHQMVSNIIKGRNRKII